MLDVRVETSAARGRQRGAPPLAGHPVQHYGTLKAPPPTRKEFVMKKACLLMVFVLAFSVIAISETQAGCCF